MAIAEFRDECLVEFRPLSAEPSWVVWQVHGHRNHPVPPHLVAEAIAACGKVGVASILDPSDGETWRSYRRATRILEFDWAA